MPTIFYTYSTEASTLELYRLLRLFLLRVLSFCLLVTLVPTTSGRNSLYVILCSMAPTILRVCCKNMILNSQDMALHHRNAYKLLNLSWPAIVKQSHSFLLNLFIAKIITLYPSILVGVQCQLGWILETTFYIHVPGIFSHLWRLDWSIVGLAFSARQQFCYVLWLTAYEYYWVQPVHYFSHRPQRIGTRSS